MVRKLLSNTVFTQHAQFLCSAHRITQTCPMGGEERGLQRRAGEGKDISLNSRRRKKTYQDLYNEIMVTFSSMILVVSVENISIFKLE